MAKRAPKTVRFTINGEKLLFLADAFNCDRLRLAPGCSSEQCDGCGRDICESGIAISRHKTIECECGTIHYAEP